MSNDDENDLALSFIAFAQAADSVANCQKVYFDACIKHGFTETQALYLTYHYDPMLFNETFGYDSSNDDDQDDSGY